MNDSDKKPTFDYHSDESGGSDDRANPYVARDLYKQEKDATKSDSQNNSNDNSDTNSGDNLRSQESDSPWKNNVNSGGSAAGAAAGKAIDAATSGKPGLNQVAKIAKKGSPIGLIAGGIIIIFFMIGAFTPSLLLNHFVETIEQAFDFQRPAMLDRNMRNINKKLSPFDKKTKGYCGEKVTIRCKFSSFSEKEIKNLKKQGITPIPDKANSFGKRYKPTEFEYTHYEGGKEVKTKYKPNELMKEMGDIKSPIRRSAILAYQPKLAGWADKEFHKRFKGKLKLFKSRPFDKKSTDEKRAKRLKEITDKEGTTEGKGSTAEACDGKEGAAKSECESKNKKTTEVDEDIKKMAEEAKKPGGVKSAMQKVGRSISLLGAADFACTMFETSEQVGIAAKTIRLSQMRNYAQVFLTASSMIKAGDIEEGDMRFLGDVLTKTVITKDANGNRKETKAATDSFGFKNAAYGDKAISDTAVEHSGGVPRMAHIDKAMDEVFSKLGGSRKSARDTCGIIHNPFVNALSIIGGVGLAALSFFPPTAPFVAPINIPRTAAQVGGMMLLQYAFDNVLVPMLIRTATGSVLTEQTFGEVSGDIITTGYQSTASEVANGGGNAPLSPAQAAANHSKMKTVSAEYGEIEKDTLSPLDLTSQYTMIGSIVNKFIPYSASINNMPTLISSQVGLLSQTLSNSLFPSSKAALNPDPTAADFTATDRGYLEAGIATTYQSVPVTGTPAEVAAIDEDEAYQALVGSVTYWEEITPNGIIPHWYSDPMINWETGEPVNKKFKQFIENCIEREGVWGEGESEDGSQKWNGKRCRTDAEAPKTGVSINTPPEGHGDKDPDGLMPVNDSEAAKHSPYITNATIVTPRERNLFYAWYQIMRIQNGREEGWPKSSASGSSAPASGVANSNQTNVATAEACKSIPDGDLAKIACSAQLFDKYTYSQERSHRANIDMKKLWEEVVAGTSKEEFDCSSLVRAAIFGATGVDIGNVNTQTMPGNKHLQEISINEAKAGDIVWRNGHTEIITENEVSRKRFKTFGAHRHYRTNPEKDIGPSSSSWGSWSKVYRFKK